MKFMEVFLQNLPMASSGNVVFFKFCVILLKLAVISAVKDAYKDWYDFKLESILQKFVFICYCP